ncbi:MAG TPA: hypothetical protein VEU96_06610 [Bryobacteraceae bacterium]|nr:hypothetical protein [Bryobacteraceae bacterium]
MRFRFQPWHWAIVLSLVCIAAAAGVYLFRMRAGSPADLVSFLPTANATVVYIDVDAIRRSGILNMIAGSKAAEELEYTQFVNATQFDYRRDLDAVAAAFKDGQVFFALRGRFHWKNLQDYAVHQGGSCRNNFCTVNSSIPQRRISFYPLQPDILALASSPDDFAAYQITRKSGKLTVEPPNQPVWMLVPALALKNSDSLPAGTKAYASALQNAEQIVFTIGPEADHLLLALNVTCPNAEAASTLLVDFENTTNTLRKWIAREHQHPNPADLSGVLVSGTFRREDRRLYGQWPLPRAFVDAVAGGSF